MSDHEKETTEKISCAPAFSEQCETNSDEKRESASPCLHQNHRKRMIDKYMNGGRDSMPDHELLEILLFSALKRVNTNPLAHALIRRFRRYELSQKSGVIFDNMEKIGGYFVSLYKGATRESVYLMMLDNSNKMIECRLLSQGSVDSAELSARKITEAALSRNSSVLILAHNHPGGTVQPSDSDITFTRAMRRALLPIDLQLVEHIIVANDEYLPLIKYLRDKDRW